VRYRNLLVLPVIAWLYAPVLTRLFAVWMYSPFFSHGIFVPAFAALVLWRDRKKLKAIEAAPSWAGLPLVGLALLMRHSTVLKGGLFFSGVSLLLLLAGLVILLYGWELFRAVLFPFSFLLLMFPIPGEVRVTLALEALSGKLAGLLLHLSGVPVQMEGNVINLSDASLLQIEVGYSLLSLLALAIVFGYFADDRRWVRVLLAIFVVPIQVVRGSFVIIIAGLFDVFAGSATALEFARAFSQWTLFIMALVMLFILHRLIAFIWKKKPSEVPPATFTELKPAQG
jgi:exosortase